MKNYRSHFKFNKQERSGIFYLLLLIFCGQLIFYIVHSRAIFPDSGSLVVNAKLQDEIDALKAKSLKEKTFVQHRFNPNFIDDSKGYTLGMTAEEIDRFLQFRALGKFVQSPEEFQKISGISDAKLMEIAPYFRFPDWKSKMVEKTVVKKPADHQYSHTFDIQDINSATADELMKVNGIGKTLSHRIVKFRDAMGGFLVNDQLYDVYGLEAAVVERALKKFRVIDQPSITKIDLNAARANEIASIIYIDNHMAQKIVALRTKVGGFSSFDELREIPDFPSDKIERIALYLSL